MNREDQPASSMWPDAAQETLLRAALSVDGSASQHFQRWLGMVDFEGHIDEGSFRVLPLVWTRLRAEEFDHPVMPRLKGVYRSCWARTARNAMLAAEVLETLSAANIPTLVLKGLPLSLAYYPDQALRPMSDSDIAVPSQLAPAAAALLKESGFSGGMSDWESDNVVRHAASYVRAGQGEMDLHWHVLFECPRDDADRPFWNHAVPLRIRDVETLRPSATELLLHVVVHGVRWNPVPPMRWIVDAAMILRSGEPIDWQRLTEFTDWHRLSRRVGLGLDYLKKRFGMAVPDAVVERLERHRSLLEKAELAVMKYEAGNPAWRHVRRSMHVIRLARSGHAAAMPRALTRELLHRYARR